MNLRERVGLNLQDLRRASGLSQEALALAAQLDRGYVGPIENRRYSISVDKIEKLAATLNVDPAELFRRRD